MALDFRNGNDLQDDGSQLDVDALLRQAMGGPGGFNATTKKPIVERN